MIDLEGRFISGATLIGAAVLLLAVGGLTGRGDVTSATLVLVGVGCFIGGVLLLSQQRGESTLVWVAGLAAAGPVIDLARLCADLGVQGNAHFIPGSGGTMQVVPVGEDSPLVLPSDDYSYITEENGGGVCIIPTGRALYDRLVREYSLVVPADHEGLGTSIREVGEEALELADAVEVVFDSDLVIVRFSGYRLIEGCTTIRSASPKICTMIGCPTCSLFACMTVAGLGRPCRMEHVAIEEKERAVRLMIRLLGPDRPQKGLDTADPASSEDKYLPDPDSIGEVNNLGDGTEILDRVQE